MGNSPYLLDSLHDLLLTILYTASVQDSVPISAILVADSGTAKSKMLKRLAGESLHHTDSFSSQGLFQLMQTDHENKINWIILPDLNPTLSRQQKTVTATVSNLLTLTMDGTCRVDDGRQEKMLKHRPIGLLSAVTPDIYQTQTKKWFSLGLTRRILPIFYTYTAETTRKLLDIVQDGKITSSDFSEETISFNGKHKPAISKEEGKYIEGLAVRLSINMGKSKFSEKGKTKWYIKTIVPISPTVILRTLAQSNAIRRNSGKVDVPDLDFLSRFLDFTDPMNPKQI